MAFSLILDAEYNGMHPIVHFSEIFPKMTQSAGEIKILPYQKSGLACSPINAGCGRVTMLCLDLGDFSGMH